MATPIPLSPGPDVFPVPEPFKEVVPEEVKKEEEPVITVEPTALVLPDITEQAATSLPPSDLYELSPVDRLLVTRRLRVKGVLFLRGKRNRFFIRTPDRNLVYTVEEENSWWVGYLCYGLRPMQLRIRNSMGNEVMRIQRPYAFTTRVMPCQLQNIKVFSPPDVLIGTVEQQWTVLKPLYLVKNGAGDDVFWIQGPGVTVSCFNDVQFHVLRPDGTHVGATCKRWEGVVHALFFAPVSDRCGIAFDKNLTVEEKALLLATTLLLDYMYYDI